MKVVLFCGGQGLRLREYSDRVPKPMVPVGPRPIMWHLMKFYAHYGHTEFILCLGHQGDVVKDYFLTYNEAKSNDFILHGGSQDGDRRGRQVEMLGRDIDDWTIT
ncbi:MAG: sugar phosphate nucleotidyltransferase, partial [Planctomycetota bacterium]